MEYHILAFTIGFVLDLIIGDPYWMPHPIRLIGSFIGLLDRWMMDRLIREENKEENKEENRKYKKERYCGILTVILVLFVTFLVTGGVIIAAWHLGRIYGVVAESVLSCYILATRSLSRESMKVYMALKNQDVESARKAVSMIVGRDTDGLDAEGIAKAAVETVAENTSDGVIAPLIYLAIGGPVLGMIYKAINTMDSMIGYHSDRYEYFGTAAARLDDVVNFLPSRISAVLMILAARLGKGFDGNKAAEIFRRDRFNHKSPNSAQTESVAAGALGLKLAGDAFYFGKKVSKPYIGDEIKKTDFEDIKRVNRLMYITAVITFMICIVLLLLIGALLRFMQRG